MRKTSGRALGILAGAMALFFSALAPTDTDGGVIVYVLPAAISDRKILPTDAFIPGKVSSEIKIIASPGEYEPASFVVQALSDVKALAVKATSLRGDKGEIPAANVDLKVVKCWYQAGEGSIAVTGRVLLPELLLNDDSLVKVDHKEKHNYLKLSYPDGEMYFCISKNEETPGVPQIPTIEQFPVKDSKTLLPVDIAEDGNKQFWVTVRVPKDAAPGAYAGKIELRIKKKLIGAVKLKLRVLPIKLLPPYYTSTFWYERGIYYKSTIGYYKSEQQYRAEMEDLLAHGVTNPKICAWFPGVSGGPAEGPIADAMKARFFRELEIRKEVGMTVQPLYYGAGYNLGFGRRTDLNDAEIAKVKRLVGEIRDAVKRFGITEVYFYGIDEGKEAQLKGQRPIWEAIHEAGGKVFVSHNLGVAYELVGDLLDTVIWGGGGPHRTEAQKWHSVGHKIWCYGNPQAGVEKPEIYRRNYGLLLWQNDFDGAVTYTYFSCFGTASATTWNDFDYSLREHNMVYPTADGVIDTIQWEGWREAIDDVRYVTTLTEAIKEAKKSQAAKTRAAALSAEKYLSKLKNADLFKRNLDTIRLEIITHILKLTGKHK